MSQRFTLLVAGDPNQRTGGYIYDAQIVTALREQGYSIDVLGVPGRFPDADDEAAEQLGRSLAAQADGALVVIDGLAMGALPEVIASHAERLKIIALLHHPLGDEQGLSKDDQQRLHRDELQGLSSVAGIIVTSHFTARRLVNLASHYAIPISAPVSVVEPGVDKASVNRAEAPGEPIRLLCVATLTPRKGQDILVQALAGIAAGNWQCDCYGAERDTVFTARVQQLVETHKLAGRVSLHGECDEATLEAAYQRAHVLVLPSWYEGYGMVVTEALARGIPVITTTGGALRDTLPEGAGITVEPGDTQALKAAIEQFCQSAELRAELRAGAVSARQQLNDWEAAGKAFAAALNSEPARLAAGSEFAADWLSLRESVDFSARSQTLVAMANEWLVKRTLTPCIADLGCGRGSNMQFLAPRMGGKQHWLLFDHDAALLRAARQRAASSRSANDKAVSVETFCASLTRLDHHELSSAHLVTASALLDLVSLEWIEALANQCAKGQQALLVALSVTGEWYFTDKQAAPIDDSEDRWVLGLFNVHQQRNKGLGEALGGAAHDALIKVLKMYRYRIEQAETPWRLEAGSDEQQPLMEALIQGWAEAATEQAPEEAARIALWRDARLAAVRAGKMGLWVGHHDLLALPAGEM